MISKLHVSIDKIGDYMLLSLVGDSAAVHTSVTSQVWKNFLQNYRPLHSKPMVEKSTDGRWRVFVLGVRK